MANRNSEFLNISLLFHLRLQHVFIKGRGDMNLMNMKGTPLSDGNQMHGEEEYLDSMQDAILRLQEDGGIAPEIAHRPPMQPVDLRVERKP
jgi:hypothetical protein